MKNFIAHSKNGSGKEHILTDHLEGVAAQLENFLKYLPYKKIFKVTGLFHDFGVSQIPSHIAQKSWMDQSENEKLIYRTHVAKSVELARRFDPTLTERSLMMIGQTHEKFNGT
ncbi:MAG TPA: hypothetical protein PKZ74_11125, partial [Bacteroidales bacterium]|nr:hypothetical protein [Bacteroidales bacterium]